VAVLVVVLASLWFVPVVLSLLSALRHPPGTPVWWTVLILLVWATPGAIAMWRAVLYLRETRPRPVQRRGFDVLPPA
jgi:hypothetical protein